MPRSQEMGAQEPIGHDPSWGQFDMEGGLEWAQIDAKKLMQFVQTVTHVGARVTLSASKLSGALGVNVFHMNEGKTWYPPSVEAVELLLDHLTAKFAAIGGRKG